MRLPFVCYVYLSRDTCVCSAHLDLLLPVPLCIVHALFRRLPCLSKGVWTLLDTHVPGGTGLWKELGITVLGAWIMASTRTLFSNAGTVQAPNYVDD